MFLYLEIQNIVFNHIRMVAIKACFAFYSTQDSNYPGHALICKYMQIRQHIHFRREHIGWGRGEGE